MTVAGSRTLHSVGVVSRRFAESIGFSTTSQRKKHHEDKGTNVGNDIEKLPPSGLTGVVEAASPYGQRRGQQPEKKQAA